MKISLLFVATALWLAFLFLGFAGVPALGPMLEVRSGVWQHQKVQIEDQPLEGLRAPVVITVDQYGVPHFFAQNAHDLYLAQGFLTASQRLFQMDLHTRQTAGELTELFGPKATPFDDFFVRFGMRESTENSLAQYKQDPQIMEMLEAYAQGANTYVKQLKDLPPEYKILGVKPRPFTAQNILNMGKALTWSLSGRSFEPQLTRYQQHLGTAAVLDLFPEFMPDHLEDFVLPEKSSVSHAKEKPEMFPFVSGLKNIPAFPLPNPGRGSNNWAVSPQKSETGRSLFANDTHLSLSLPSTWYENQLSCPDFNVYGVSLAAVPGIVNGFNKDVAWGPTNGATDVLDFFEIEFENETSLRYKFNGAWEEPEVRRELIRLKPFGSQAVDVVKTKLGRLLHREGRLGLVADWTGHRPGHELLALRGQYAARTADECMRSFAQWSVPIQNFMCVDRQNIGWLHAGFVPLRKVGEGRFFRDGRIETQGLIQALEPVPQSKNPKQGYLLSANQKIVSADYPNYLGWDYEPPFRGMNIRRFLSEQRKFSAVDMITLQSDNLDLQAEMFLPKLLRHLKAEGLDERQKLWLEKLKQWDFRIRFDDGVAALFKAWQSAFKEQIFADELETAFLSEKKLFPKDARVLWLIERLEKDPKDSDAQWVDDKATPDRRETLDEVATKAFVKSFAVLEENMGKDQAHWTWKNWNKTHFMHIGRLPGFGTDILAMSGSAETVRGLSALHGATYKIVVAAGEWPEAWIQVPGGNEGDPFSPDFERFVPEWTHGQMRPVEFYRDVAEAEQKAKRVIHLRPVGGAL